MAAAAVVKGFGCGSWQRTWRCWLALPPSTLWPAASPPSSFCASGACASGGGNAHMCALAMHSFARARDCNVGCHTCELQTRAHARTQHALHLPAAATQSQKRRPCSYATRARASGLPCARVASMCACVHASIMLSICRQRRRCAHRALAMHMLPHAIATISAGRRERASSVLCIRRQRQRCAHTCVGYEALPGPQLQRNTSHRAPMHVLVRAANMLVVRQRRRRRAHTFAGQAALAVRVITILGTWRACGKHVRICAELCTSSAYATPAGATALKRASAMQLWLCTQLQCRLHACTASMCTCAHPACSASDSGRGDMLCLCDCNICHCVRGKHVRIRRPCNMLCIR